MATFIGPGRAQALETRRSPYKPEGFICKGCTARASRQQGKQAFVYVKRARIYQDGLMRPGVQCPQCLTAWIEAEDQPEEVQ